MPTSTWTSTVAFDSGDDTHEVGSVTATHFDGAGVADASFSARIKLKDDSELDKFVALAHEQLMLAADRTTSTSTVVSALDDKLNA